MIVTVYTEIIAYTSLSKEEYRITSKNVVVNNCTFTQTNYGSVIIDRPTGENIIELYPNSISHITHSK